LNRVLLVFLGSGLGGVARYGVQALSQSLFGTDFPYGTVSVNVVGSFFIVVVMHLGLTAQAISPEARLFWTTGILGGFTTYSSFNYETIALAQRGEVFAAVANVALTVVLCLGSGALGLYVGRQIA
jgi:fluoride exporter